MSGLPCAKAVIDNGRATVQVMTSNLAAIERALGCMSNSIQLGATVKVYPTEEMENEFIKASIELKDDIARATNKYLVLVADISAYFDPVVTDKPSNKDGKV